MSRRPSEFATHPMPFPTPHVVRAVVRRVIDGDTLDCFVDLGFCHYTYIAVRVAGIDTPEIVGATREAGLAAKTYVERLLLNRPVELRVQPDRQTFGRWVADVRFQRAFSDEWVDLAAALRAAGMVP